MHITIDQDKGLVFIPKLLFEQHEEEIVNELQNFVFRPSGEHFISIQLPNKLPAKQIANVYFKGTEKQDKTCLFCTKRIRCTTNGWKCDGYIAGKGFLKEFDEIEPFLSKLSFVLYARVDV